jgi:hypothetical protein
MDTPLTDNPNLEVSSQEERDKLIKWVLSGFAVGLITAGLLIGMISYNNSYAETISSNAIQPYGISVPQVLDLLEVAAILVIIGVILIGIVATSVYINHLSKVSEE